VIHLFVNVIMTY